MPYIDTYNVFCFFFSTLSVWVAEKALIRSASGRNPSHLWTKCRSNRSWQEKRPENGCGKRAKPSALIYVKRPRQMAEEVGPAGLNSNSSYGEHYRETDSLYQDTSPRPGHRSNNSQDLKGRALKGAARIEFQRLICSFSLRKRKGQTSLFKHQLRDCMGLCCKSQAQSQ